MKICSRCGDEKDLDHFYPDKSKRDGRSSRCKQCQKEVSREKHWADPEASRARMREWAKSDAGRASVQRRFEALRSAALNAYGNECACCGEKEEAFLTVDHVGGWGAEHRATIGTGAGNIYQWLKKSNYPQDGTIQLLCWNCNCALGIRGYCPHRKTQS